MEKKFKKGLVLGKFMPVHFGHLFLISQAEKQCEEVVVMVCTQENEPINGFMRYAWVKMLCDADKNIKVMHVTDENPQKPEECSSKDEFYNDFWVPSVESRVSDLDVVFTSEEYGDEFAQYLGIQHVLVDIDRKKYPVSATEVRNNPFYMWKYIPDIVKPYYTKRILIMGPESTGKTTLCKKLHGYYGGDYVPEYGRTYTETIKPAKDLDKEDFYKIANHHDNQMLGIHESTIERALFIDTDGVTTKLFGEMYLEGYNDERVDEIISHQWFDLILVMGIDVPWVNDGTRDFPQEEQRKKHFNKIISELKKLHRWYFVIDGTYDERFDKATQLCERVFNNQPLC